MGERLRSYLGNRNLCVWK